MKEAFVLGGLRTPYGKVAGALGGLDTLGLGVAAVNALRARHEGLDQADGALFGVVMQAGQGPNPARTVTYRADLPKVPAITLNDACLAGVDSVVDASRRVERGEGSLYLVGGFDSSSCVSTVTPQGAAPRTALEHDALTCQIDGMSMAELSDRRNAVLGIDRETQDALAVESHRRAAAADFVATGEVAPLGALNVDEGVRPGSTLEKVAALDPLFPGGTITAANASQVSDGAAVGIVGDHAAAERLGVEPLARVAGWGYSAGPTGSLHEQPVDSSQDLLKRAGLGTSDIDLWEINEAFAGVAVHARRELGLSSDVVNVNGGAIAVGHPYGGTGFRLVLTLALELSRRDLRRGIATLCGAGGQGIAVLLDRGWAVRA